MRRYISLVSIFIFFIYSVNFSLAANGQEQHRQHQNEVLLETPFEALPIGSVKAKGWLLHQLELQKEGLTGHMEEISPDLSSDSGWLGGNGEDWERGPYYVKGLVSLAYVLDDDELKKKAQKWIDWSINSQRNDGFFGPESNTDWWPRMPMLSAIRDYYEATGDERVIPFMTKYFRYQLETLPSQPLSSWAKARGGDNIDSVYWLYERTGDEWLLDLATLLYNQSEDWTDIYTNNNFDGSTSHVVNIAQGMKLPPLYYRQTKDLRHRDALMHGMEHLLRHYGRIDGMYNADEPLRDIGSTHGVELDAIVEYMLSFEIAQRVLGDATYGDQLEKVAFNALPAALTPDIKGHTYYILQNSVLNTVGHHGFGNDHGDSSVFGAPAGFECCFMNFHMGWPKFVQNMWMATQDDGLAITAYGPSEVTAKVGDGVDVKITEDTDYPFSEQIKLHVHTDKSVSFPLKLRIPGWSKATVVKVNGEEQQGIVAGEYFTIDRTWSDGDVVTLDFPMTINVTNWENNAVGVERGPLVYSLQIGEEWRVYEGNDAREIKLPHPEGFPLQEVVPTTDWNYGLIVDRNNPESSFEVIKREVPYQPFSNRDAPIVLKAKAKKIPSWKLDGNIAGPLPQSPVISDEPIEEVNLIPYGAARLRLSLIPQIGKPTGTYVHEAETAQVNGAEIKKSESAANRKFVDRVANDTEGFVHFKNVTVPVAKSYDLKIRYANGEEGNGYHNLYINGQQIATISFPSTGAWDQFNDQQTVTIENINLDASLYNDITLKMTRAENSVQLDNIEIIPNGAITEPKITAIEVNGPQQVTLNTNVDQAIGTYKIVYGKESGQYTHTAFGFKSSVATLTGLEPETTYYFKIVASLNGRVVESGEKSATTKATEGDRPAPDASFSDQFESGHADQWTEYGDTERISVQDGTYVFGRSTNVKSVAGDVNWTDYVMEADIRIKDGSRNNAGIMFRITEPGSGPDNFHGYYAGIGTAGNKGKGLLIGFGNGNWNDIEFIPFDVETDKTYRIKAVVYKDVIKVYVDDELKHAFRDGRFSRGQIGLRSYDEPFIADNVLVRNIKPEDIEDINDILPPGEGPEVSALNNYGTVSIKYEKVPAATSYKVQYGTESGNYTMEQYGVIFNPYKGSAPFSYDWTSIGGLKNGTPYYFRIVPMQDHRELTPSKELMVIPGKSREITSEAIKVLVEHLEKEGEFANEKAPHTLKVHLIAIARYEQQEAGEKVVKHMTSFKQLLDHQKENEWISEKAYNLLKANANLLINRWQ